MKVCLYVGEDFVLDGIRWIDEHPKVFKKKAKEYLSGVYGDKLGTNNPYIVDFFEAEQVICVFNEREKKLSDNKEWEKKKGVLSVGEFWGSVGESWIESQVDSINHG